MNPVRIEANVFTSNGGRKEKITLYSQDPTQFLSGHFRPPWIKRVPVTTQAYVLDHVQTAQ
jgi:hypothetical protein